VTVKLLEPVLIEQYIDADGRLTLEGMKLFERMINMLKDHEARITALEA
jgi:hypothetical protein